MEGRALAQVALAGDFESRDQLARVFLIAFWALTLVLIRRRRDLLESDLAFFAEKLVERHISYYRPIPGRRQSAKIRL